MRVTRALSPNQATTNGSLYDDWNRYLWARRSATCLIKMDFACKVKLISLVIFECAKYSGLSLSIIDYNQEKDY